MRFISALAAIGLAGASLTSSGCKDSKNERGTCLNKQLDNCSVNQVRYQCEAPGDTFNVGEKAPAGVTRCKSLGYTNPMNSAIDLNNQSYRLDIRPPSPQQQVETALEKGHVITYYKPEAYPAM